MKRKLARVIFFLLLFIQSLQNVVCAQSCGTVDTVSLPVPKFPVSYTQTIRTNQHVRTTAQPVEELPVLFKIPVVVHIIERSEAYKTDDEKKLTDERVLDILTETNLLFRNKYKEDVTGNGADTQIQFCLAQKDPEGNSTTGIKRYDGSVYPGFDTEYVVSDANEDQIRLDIDWNIKSANKPLYVNIYVVNKLNDLKAGWAELGDGSFIFLSARADEYIWAHELGHALGLHHTFKGGCDEVNCEVDGDQVCDTPPTISNETDSDCNSKSPCGVLGQPGNIMAYTDCAIYFTQGQKERMFSFLHPSNYSHNSLLASAYNLTLTGCGETVPPIVGLIQKDEIMCSSDTVHVELKTIYNNVDAEKTTWNTANGVSFSTGIDSPLKQAFVFNSEGYHNVFYTLESDWGKIENKIISPYIIHPSVRTTLDTIVDIGESLILEESNSHLITSWYSDSLGEDLIMESKSIEISEVVSDTSFYIVNRDTSLYKIIPGPYPEEASALDGYPGFVDSVGVAFDVLQTITLKSVDVKIVGWGFGIKITDESGVELAYFPVDLNAKAPNYIFTVPMNITLSPGSYRMIKTINKNGYTEKEIGFETVEYPLELPAYIRLKEGIYWKKDKLCFFNWRIKSDDFYCSSDLQKVSIGVVKEVSGLPFDLLDKLVIHPNPTTSELFVTGVRGPKKVELYDVSGKLWFDSLVLDDRFDLGNIPQGVYTLRVLVDGDVRVFRVLKN